MGPETRRRWNGAHGILGGPPRLSPCSGEARSGRWVGRHRSAARGSPTPGQGAGKRAGPRGARPLKISTVIVVVNVALALGFLAGYLWQQQELERLRRGGSAPSPTAAVGAERVANSRGVVRDIAADRRAVLITHEALGALMGGMTMRFRSPEPALLEGVQVGDRVQFTVRARDGDLLLEALRRDAS
ncbi:MAG: hypothetical protein C5B48_06480 [Candidatus Rokuibacteriota bacterium]|nr:MAG: hypothetical protein C5B48_06480 [Candidatus Rokubacteria bacterium]